MISFKPATAIWEDERSPFARVSLDPILFTDDGHFGGTNSHLFLAAQWRD